MPEATAPAAMVPDGTMPAGLVPDGTMPDGAMTTEENTMAEEGQWATNIRAKLRHNDRLGQTEVRDQSTDISVGTTMRMTAPMSTMPAPTAPMRWHVLALLEDGSG